MASKPTGDPTGPAGLRRAVREAYGHWPHFNVALTRIVESLSADELAYRAAPDRWPVWAIAGHVACQRVFWLGEFAGAPGIDATPFHDSGNSCPGDDYLEPIMSASELKHALTSSFALVEHCLDLWRLDSLGEEISTRLGEKTFTHTRAWTIQRVFFHDGYHAGEIALALRNCGRHDVDLALWG